MRFIADENIDDDVVELIRETGHDVLSVSEFSPGMVDAEILAVAVRESRTVITYDKSDFGELVFRHNLPPPPGIILFRISILTAREIPYFILGSIAARADWQGYFWVIDERGVRSRPFPAQ